MTFAKAELVPKRGSFLHSTVRLLVPHMCISSVTVAAFINSFSVPLLKLILNFKSKL